MAEDMTHEQALSFLNRMDAEDRNFQQQFQARQYVKGVIQAYTAAQKGLAELEEHQARLEASIAGLKARHTAERKQVEDDIAKTRTELEMSVDPLRQQIADLKTEAARLDADLKDKQLFGSRRSAELQKEIEAKVQELEGLKADIIQLRKKHGLGG